MRQAVLLRIYANDVTSNVNRGWSAGTLLFINGGWQYSTGGEESMYLNAPPAATFAFRREKGRIFDGDSRSGRGFILLTPMRRIKWKIERSWSYIGVNLSRSDPLCHATLYS